MIGMNEEIAGYRVRFIDRGGHYMVLEQGSGREHLAELQVQMLTTGEIPGLLPLRVDEVDSNVQLLYNISSHKMLHYALQIRKLSGKDTLDLIRSMMDIIGNSLNYLLHDNKYLLHERMIFIGDNWGDVRLTYVPGIIATTPSLQEQIQKLLALLVKHLQNHDENCKPIISLHQYCERDSWTLTGFIQELEKSSMVPFWLNPQIDSQTDQRADQRYDHRADQRIDNKPSEKKPFSEDICAYPNPDILRQEKRDEDERFKREQVHLELPKAEENWKGSWWEEVEEDSPSRSFLQIKVNRQIAKTIIYILLAAAIITLIQTAMNPVPLWIYSSMTMLILLLIGVFLLKNSLLNKQEEAGEPKQPILNQMYNQLETQRNDPVDLEQYYQGLSNKTSFLTPNHTMATTLLNSESRANFDNNVNNGNKTEKQPVLEFTKNGTVERMRIDKIPFLIGREDASVNLSVGVAGVSRMHAEISGGFDGYVIRDLDSKNGTTLNERELVPYESYAVSDGDVIGIVSYRITFRTK